MALQVVGDARPHAVGDRTSAVARGLSTPELQGPPTLALQGWTVAVTGARRGVDVVRLLEQRGARVLHVPALRIVPLEDDSRLYAATMECLSAPFDVVVATTGNGFQTWLEAADGWGLGEALREALATARVFARGPKASGAVKAAGLEDVAASSCESTWDILEQLLSCVPPPNRVIVQLHGAPLDDFIRTLHTAGADVVEVPVYRTVPPEAKADLERLVDQVLTREVDAVTFTNAAAVSNLLDASTRRGVLDALLDAFQDVLPACVGAVAAAPLERLCVSTVQPPQARIGSLVHALTAALEAKILAVEAAGHTLELRGTGVVLDGNFRALAPAPMAALRALAGEPGRVLSRAELAQAMPGSGTDEHAVEMAISRLRSGLGDPRCVVNVVKRGYRLAHYPHRDAALEPDLDEPAFDEESPSLVVTAPLLDSVGGAPGIRQAVERLYTRLLGDPLLSHYFQAVDMPRLKRHQVLLLSQLLGGPAQYKGRELAAAHEHLNIRAAHYRRVIDHLVAVLEELSVSTGAIGSIRRALEALEQDVVTDRA